MRREHIGQDAIGGQCGRPICERNIKQAALPMVAPLVLSKKNRYRSSLGLFVQNQSMSITAHRSPSTLQDALDRNNRRAF